MIVAKSEKTGLGDTAVLYWDTNHKKYQLNVYDPSHVESDEPKSSSIFSDQSIAFQTFDEIIWSC